VSLNNVQINEEDIELPEGKELRRKLLAVLKELPWTA
jgi:hypothetical protein